MLIGSRGSPLAKGGCLPLCRCQHWESGRRSWEWGKGGQAIRELQRRDIAHRSHLVRHGVPVGCCGTTGWTGDEECATSSTRISNWIHYYTPVQGGQVLLKPTELCFILKLRPPFNLVSMSSVQTFQDLFVGNGSLHPPIHLPPPYLSYPSVK